MWYRTALIILSLFFVLSSTQHTIATSHQNERNLWRVVKPPSTQNLFIYEAVIVPWLHKEFANSTFVDSGGFVKRGLVRSDLLRFENIEGQDRFNVHIEYRVFIKDISGTEIVGLKGQEIVFWINDDMVEDYFPFEEYWIEGRVLQGEE